MQEEEVIEPSAPTKKLFFDDENTQDFYFDYDRLMSDRSVMVHRDGYFMGAANDFARIFTIKGRKYWLAQALTNHRAPDWKVHFSVVEEDVPKAFNILSEHFYNTGCSLGMKACFTNNNWPDHMKGREITMYIYRYYNLNNYRTVREFVDKSSPFIEHSVDSPNSQFHNRLYEFDRNNAHPFEMYELEKQDQDLAQLRSWVKKAEELLENAGVRTNGCADGDRWLNGKYTSLRNETFVVLARRKDSTDVERWFAYPPNDAGWNAAGHEEDGEYLFDQLRLDKEPHSILKAALAYSLFTAPLFLYALIH